MKKLLLATAVAALSVSAAQAAPTVYGKAFLTLDMQDGDTDVTKNGVTSSSDLNKEDTRSQLNSNASRIGFKGSEALTANTDLVYQLEYGVDVAENESDQFKSRDTYMGLSNAQYGTLIAGRLTAVDDYVNYANVTEGGVLGGNAVQASFDAPRANNSFAYVSPNYDGMTFLAMYVMDEYDAVNFSVDAAGGKVPVTRDAFGVAAKYEPASQPVRGGISYIQAGDFKVARVSGAFDVSPVATIGALYQMGDTGVDGLKKENTFTLSGEMKTATPWTAYAQGDMVQNYQYLDNSDLFRVVVGGKYAFNKATTGHLYGAFRSIEVKTDTTKTETDAFGIGGGIEYKF